MTVIKTLCIFFGLIYFANGIALPFTACSKSDPDLGKCAVTAALNGWKEFTKGDKRLKVPALSPLIIDEIKLDASESLKMVFTNLKVNGLIDFDFKKIDIDVDKKHWDLELGLDHLNFESTYDISGKILILPINGHGPGNVTMVKPIFSHKFDYVLEDRKGVQYAKISKSKITFTQSRMTFDFQNLFNGDPTLGPEMNKFLNENWDEVAKEVGPALAEAIGAVADSIINGVFDKIPYNDIIKP